MSHCIIIRGPLGVGKTTIARALAKKIGATHISFDKILEENGLDKNDDSFTPADFIKANGFAIKAIRDNLRSNKPLIFDGCFYFKEQIDNLKLKLAGNNFQIFSLKAPLAVCISRDSGRKKVYGEKAAKEVYALVAAVDVGISIDTTDKTSRQVVSEIMMHFSKI